MTNTEQLLQIITLAVVGWTLLEIISLKVKLAALSQILKDLKCIRDTNSTCEL